MPYYRQRKYNRRGKRSYNKRPFKRVAGTVRKRYTGQNYQAYRGYKKKWSKWQKATPSKCTRLIKFNYVDSAFDMSTVVGNSYQEHQVFAGNGLFDPDITGVGSQPYGYDNWCGASGFFSKYKVYASKITIYVSSTNVSGTMPVCKVFLFPSETLAPAFTNPGDLTQYAYCKQGVLGANTTTGLLCKITNYSTSKLILGKEKANDEEATAASTANPSNIWYWHVYIDTSGWTVEATIKMDIKIKYYTKLQDPNAFQLS